jgi:hypothetical protein
VSGLGIHKFISTTEVGSWVQLSFGGERVVQIKRRRRRRRIAQ